MADNDAPHLCIEKTTGNKTLPLSNLRPSRSGSGPPSLAVLHSTFWNPGTSIRVKFMSGGTPRVRQRVQYYAQQWEQYANIDFRFVADDDPDADIRISFEKDGSWSYLGTECWTIPKDEATMNYGWFDDNTSEQEFSRTTIHEFGHALGCVHEHQSPKALIDWDREAVYAAFVSPDGWSREDVDRNIFNRYTAAEVEESLFDINSIMMYFFPGRLVKSRVGSPVNYVLSVTDKAMITTIYPFQTHNSGAWSTLSDRLWYPPVALNARQIDFDPPYPSPPRVVVGLTSVDMYYGTNLRVKAYADNIAESKFRVHIDSWANTELYSGDATWVEAEDADADYQTGTFDTQGLHPWNQPQQKNSARIKFKNGYQDTPNVVVWLSGFDMAKGHNWRIAVSADGIDKDGFTIHLDSWADTVLYAAQASWIAYAKGKDGVASGADDTRNYRPWYPAQEKNGRKVDFKAGMYNRVPKVFAALNYFDFDSARNMRIKVSTPQVTADGFTWHGDTWGDSLCYGVGVSWIAFG
ncbi:hypothetical protein W97_01135 [Coniosporium apollinis CBS 100218]|uniref:Peptidase metallopeptidase domain-containing protein n=1 Tax=Coniosporium apollinis (strain CBS 100218) TaxID=1168221 RepID=R7YJ09_CONA1|nr:uncharacterized protein W97_01135 [Coniosporium apollinis CBS 100218]EON61917.1 hypothetical protein W97_01135 [Coniosporium apollinis CBS 100218]